jgi:hypothetical protein
MKTAQLYKENNKVKLHGRNINNLIDLADLLNFTLARTALLRDAFSSSTILSDEFEKGAELALQDIYFDLKAACKALDDLSTENKG